MAYDFWRVVNPPEGDALGTLQNAITQVLEDTRGVGGTILLTSGVYKITLTQPASFDPRIALRFDEGAKLKVVRGAPVQPWRLRDLALRLPGPLVAGAHQIFELSQGDAVSLQHAGTTITPVWWGADPSGEALSTGAFRKMALSIAGVSGPRVVDLQPGTYGIDSIVLLPPGVSMTGFGAAINYTSGQGTLVVALLVDVGAPPVTTFRGLEFRHARPVLESAPRYDLSGHALAFGAVAPGIDVVIEDCAFTGCPSGLYAGPRVRMQVINIRTTGCPNAVTAFLDAASVELVNLTGDGALNFTDSLEGPPGSSAVVTNCRAGRLNTALHSATLSVVALDGESGRVFAARDATVTMTGCSFHAEMGDEPASAMRVSGAGRVDLSNCRFVLRAQALHPVLPGDKPEPDFGLPSAGRDPRIGRKGNRHVALALALDDSDPALVTVSDCLFEAQFPDLFLLSLDETVTALVVSGAHGAHEVLVRGGRMDAGFSLGVLILGGARTSLSNTQVHSSVCVEIDNPNELPTELVIGNLDVRSQAYMRMTRVGAETNIVHQVLVMDAASANLLGRTAAVPPTVLGGRIIYAQGPPSAGTDAAHGLRGDQWRLQQPIEEDAYEWTCVRSGWTGLRPAEWKVTRRVS